MGTDSDRTAKVRARPKQKYKIGIWAVDPSEDYDDDTTQLHEAEVEASSRAQAIRIVLRRAYWQEERESIVTIRVRRV